MALTNWGFIYTADGSREGGEWTTVDTGQCRTTLVGVARPDESVEVARRLVAEGVQLIELCGGFGPVWAAKIREATGGAVPLGVVGYGPESVSQVHAIFAPES
jgi:uncharacterized protein DUF6506